MEKSFLGDRYYGLLSCDFINPITRANVVAKIVIYTNMLL